MKKRMNKVRKKRKAKLKCCPLCGHEARYTQTRQVDMRKDSETYGKYITFYGVKCLNDGSCDCNIYGCYKKSYATLLWNSRVSR